MSEDGSTTSLTDAASDEETPEQTAEKDSKSLADLIESKVPRVDRIKRLKQAVFDKEKNLVLYLQTAEVGSKDKTPKDKMDDIEENEHRNDTQAHQSDGMEIMSSRVPHPLVEASTKAAHAQIDYGKSIETLNSDHKAVCDSLRGILTGGPLDKHAEALKALDDEHKAYMTKAKVLSDTLHDELDGIRKTIYEECVRKENGSKGRYEKELKSYLPKYLKVDNYDAIKRQDLPQTWDEWLDLAHVYDRRHFFMMQAISAAINERRIHPERLAEHRKTLDLDVFKEAPEDIQNWRRRQQSKLDASSSAKRPAPIVDLVFDSGDPSDESDSEQSPPKKSKTNDGG